MKYNEYSEQNYNEVLRLYETGMRISKISKRVNIPRSTIRSWLKLDIEKVHFKQRASDEEFINAVNSSISIAETLKKLNLKLSGGNYYNLKTRLNKLNLTCEHWKGQSWSKDEQLKDWTKYTRNSTVKKQLIKVRGHKCEQCNLTTWKEQEIPIELHHKDGDRCNNSLENLELLCCNCHGLTENYCVPKNYNNPNPIKTLQCLDCSDTISYGSVRCRECEIKNRVHTTKINWPTDEELSKLVWEIPSSILARRLGVSDQAIHKRCKKRNIPKPESGYWSKLKNSQS